MSELSNHDCVEIVDELSERMELSHDPGRRGEQSEYDKFRHACLTRAGYRIEMGYEMPDDKEDDHKVRKDRKGVDDLFDY